MCPFSLDIAWLISSFHDDFAPSSTQDIRTNSAGLPRKKSARESSISGNVRKHEQYAIGHYQQEWAFRG